jgi:hypothetical protein
MVLITILSALIAINIALNTIFIAMNAIQRLKMINLWRGMVH